MCFYFFIFFVSWIIILSALCVVSNLTAASPLAENRVSKLMAIFAVFTNISLRVCFVTANKLFLYV